MGLHRFLVVGWGTLLRNSESPRTQLKGNQRGFSGAGEGALKPNQQDRCSMHKAHQAVSSQKAHCRSGGEHRLMDSGLFGQNR